MLIARRTHAKLCVNVCYGTMAANALIDTGAILALLDRTDRWHRVCVGAFEQLRLPLVTSEAVLTELFHLVGDSRHEMEAAWRLVRSGAIVLAAIEDSELSQNTSTDVALFGSPDGFRRCNSRVSREA